jgi:hypothetical protein
MLAIIIVGLVMIGINITFSYLELIPFIEAVKYEKDRTRGTISCFTLVFRLIRHLPKCIPTIIDMGSMVIMTHLFSLGTGYAGGIAGLFASNLISVFIYLRTHKRKKASYA